MVWLDAMLAPVRWEGMTVDQLTVVEATARSSHEPASATQPQVEAGAVLSGELAHELNNLLLIVSGNATLAMQSPELAEGGSEVLRRIQDAANRGSRLLRKMLAPQACWPVSLAPVEVSSAVDCALEMLRPSLPECCRVQVTHSDAALHVMGNAEAMEHILFNLLGNARDAMPDGGTVSIRISPANVQPGQLAYSHGVEPGPYVRISVTDTGEGMSEDVLARIFEEQFSTKPSHAGSGLGLTVVRSLVRQQRGFVEVESRRGMGTAVHVYLPAVEAPAGETATAAQPSKVLVVEPDTSVSRLIERILDDVHVRVIAVPDAAEAARLLEEKPEEVSLVMLSVANAARRRGRPALDQLLSFRPGLPVLLMTCEDPDADTTELMLRRGWGFVRKPFRMDELTAAVRQWLPIPEGV